VFVQKNNGLTHWRWFLPANPHFHGTRALQPSPRSASACAVAPQPAPPTRKADTLVSRLQEATVLAKLNEGDIANSRDYAAEAGFDFIELTGLIKSLEVRDCGASRECLPARFWRPVVSISHQP
jgi:hypothetical protein